MASKSWYIWLVRAAIAAFLVWAFVYLKDLHPLGSLSTKASDGDLSGVSIRFKGATLAGWAGGSKLWSLDSKNIQVSDDRRCVTFDGLAHGKLFEVSNPVATLAASRLVYNTYTQDLYAPKPVDIKFVSGPSLRAANAYWNCRKSKLIVERGVDVHIAGSAIHGESAEVDFHNRELKIHKLKGELDPDKALGGE
jgi:hypothetical protein